MINTDGWFSRLFHVSGWANAVVRIRWINKGTAGVVHTSGPNTTVYPVPVFRLYPTHQTYNALTGLDKPFPVTIPNGSAAFYCWAANAFEAAPAMPLPVNKKPGYCRQCRSSILPKQGGPEHGIHYVAGMGYAHYVAWNRWQHLSKTCVLQEQRNLFSDNPRPRRRYQRDHDEAIHGSAGIYEAIDPYGDNGGAFLL